MIGKSVHTNEEFKIETTKEDESTLFRSTAQCGQQDSRQRL